ncbi:glutathione S-transferase family protein [Pseudomonas sp. 7P_10.2_Bac1]|uniref:glutathione S-transferase family protein n=1 Tax=Pseudomonas sp. 7P_10.2_Bac1 TaxID=2971614 RepID=UPI0021C577E8|nr:glutathione S-transferase family protein [Pseudomonas sp. 7P_10.2_Bac1]MCU1728067.1 glutathione S-transferase family protein [Pseudomonas sp. 7P_10.2_Bac1]
MGLLIDGHWHDQWYKSSKDGAFEREQAQRRNWVTTDGAPGPTGTGGFAAQAGRYHLYVSLACPWAHRTLITRKLKGLDALVDVSVVSWLMLEDGWTFDKAHGSTGDKLDDLRVMYQRYTRDTPDYTGRVTVPVLWDSQRQCIVSNESADIIRMFNSAFNELTGNTLNLYPQALAVDIDRWNASIYPALNNGVYRAGFATSQSAYEQAYDDVFHELEQLERYLATHRYLAGEYLTEADVRLFTTLIRFDAVYYSHFKCNERRVVDYPNLCNWLLELYQWPGVAQTVDFTHIKGHYYASHRTINPTGIIPKGPALNFDKPHDRARLTGKGIWQR